MDTEPEALHRDVCPKVIFTTLSTLLSRLLFLVGAGLPRAFYCALNAKNPDSFESGFDVQGSTNVDEIHG